MDLDRVAVFVRVVDERGFTAAARALGLPKSSVSRSIALLEHELGARLLLRSTRSVALTEAGSAFYERVSRGLAAIDEAREAVVELESALRGPVRVTAPVDAGYAMLAPLVADFAAVHPEVVLDVVLTGRVVDLVEEGFDLALRAGAVRDESLVARSLGPIRFALYASPAYLEAHGTPRRLADLARHRCVLFRAGREPRMRWTLTGPRGEESVEVGGPIRADDLGFVRSAAIASGGIALLPDFLAEHGVPGARGALSRVLPRHASTAGVLHVVHPAGRYLPRRVATFRDFLIERLGGTRIAPRSRR